MKRVSLFLVSVTVVIAVAVHDVVAQGKPVRSIVGDFMPLMYESVQQFCQGVDMVVVATAGSSQTRKFKTLGRDDAETVYTMTAEQVVRQSVKHPSTTKTFELTLPIGKHDVGNEVVEHRSKSLKPLVKGNSYLLFLGWKPTANAFYPVAGPGGIYEVVDGTLKTTTAEQPLASEIAAQTLDTLLSKLRTAPSCAR